MQIFSLLDMKSNGIHQGFFSINAATAIREVTEHVAQGRIPSNYATDYALYLVGDQDNENMRITALENPKHIIDLREIVQEVENG